MGCDVKRIIAIIDTSVAIKKIMIHLWVSGRIYHFLAAIPSMSKIKS